MCTGHHITLAKVSNVILRCLTDQEKTWVTMFYKFIAFLRKSYMEIVTEKNVLVVLNF